jgi:hypothetical protein
VTKTISQPATCTRLSRSRSRLSAQSSPSRQDPSYSTATSCSGKARSTRASRPLGPRSSTVPPGVVRPTRAKPEPATLVGIRPGGRQVLPRGGPARCPCLSASRPSPRPAATPPDRLVVPHRGRPPRRAAAGRGAVIRLRITPLRVCEPPFGTEWRSARLYASVRTRLRGPVRRSSRRGRPSASRVRTVPSGFHPARR